MIHTILCVDTLGATAAPMLAMLLDYEIERANKKRAELGAPALQVEVISAGTYEGADKDFDPSSLHEATLQCMADFSIDQTAQRPHRIMSLPLMRFDMIVCIGVDALNFVSRCRPRGAVMLAMTDDRKPILEPLDIEQGGLRMCAVLLSRFAGEFVYAYL